MKRANLEQLGQEAFDTDRHESAHDVGRTISQPRPSHPFRHKDPLRGQFVVDLRHVNSSAHSRLQLPFELLLIPRLGLIIQLAVSATGPSIQQHHVVHTTGGELTQEEARQPRDVAQDVHVDSDRMGHAWALDLHRHLATVMTARPPVNLPQGGSCHRLWLNVRSVHLRGGAEREQIAQGLSVVTKAGLQDLSRSRPRKWRAIIAQALEFLQRSFRHQVRPDGQGLAGFHEGWAQARENLPGHDSMAMTHLLILQGTAAPIENNTRDQWR
mmetsp:Transcript_55408/g.160900  ORF Transcript_55408/g.160900 Transcript_55408/m.160900 type:complete len:270 (-) Transcript_55408:439-1248(-)